MRFSPSLLVALLATSTFTSALPTPQHHARDDPDQPHGIGLINNPGEGDDQPHGIGIIGGGPDGIGMNDGNTKPPQNISLPGEPNGMIDCVDGLHLVALHGIHVSTRQPQIAAETHDLPELTKAIRKRIPYSDAVAVRYPLTVANFEDGGFMNDVDNGTAILKRHVWNYVDTCGPNHPIALLGYGQGALVVSDAFVGSGEEQDTSGGHNFSENAWPNEDPTLNMQWGTGIGRLEEKYLDSIVAAAVFSSPTAWNGLWQDYHRGTASENGMYATARGPLDVGKDIFASFCDEKDFMCAPDWTTDYGTAHSKIVQNHAEEAADFIVDAYEMKMQQTSEPLPPDACRPPNCPDPSGWETSGSLLRRFWRWMF